MNGLFPEDSAERKTYPVFSGLIQYFPSALALVARHSYHGNEKHNPGQPLNHDRSKSGDEADALLRHLMEGDYVGMAWRALSLLQKDCEAKGAPIAPAATNAVLPASQVWHTAAAIASRDGHTADGGGVIPEAVAKAMLRDQIADPEREDDTGDIYPDPRYGGAACNIGGRCDD